MKIGRGRPHKPYLKKLVSEKLHSPKTGEDYVGMNRYAARVLEIPFSWSYHTIVLWKGLDRKGQKDTFDHEISEAEKMKKGASYEKGHKEAPHTDQLTPVEKQVSRLNTEEQSVAKYEEAEFVWRGES